jgi:hypothetical protein
VYLLTLLLLYSNLYLLTLLPLYSNLYVLRLGHYALTAIPTQIMHDLPVLRFMQVMQVMQVMLAKHERPTTRNKSKNQGLAAGEMKRISPA